MLFLDEPTSGVDPIARGAFWDLIHDLSETGHTIFVSTHYMDEAEYCHRLALMYRGKVIALGTPAELKAGLTAHSLLNLDASDPLETMRALEGLAGVHDVAVFGGGLHVTVDDRGCDQRADPRAAGGAGHRGAEAGADRAFDGGRVRGPDRGRGKEGRMSYRRMRAICVKELHHITRDSRSLAMALAVPVMMLLLFGFALSLDVDRIPDDDLRPGPDGGEPRADPPVPGLAILRNPRHGERLRGDRTRHRPQPHSDGRGDSARLFGSNSAPGAKAQVQILLDGSDSNTASIALGYAESLVRSYSLELRTAALNRRGGEHLAPPVDAQMRVWYNSSLESKNYVVPGLIAVILQIIAALLTSLTIAREWEMGTMEQILSTPLRPAEMVLGKMLAYFVVGLADATIAVLVGVFVFEVPFRGSLPLLAVSTCVFLFGALFWGIFVSAAARTQVAAYQMGILSSFLPAFLLSGFVYSIETMPWVIQVITHIVPARYVVTILKGIFLKGVGLSVLWGELGFLALYALIVFLLATRKLNQKLA